MTLQIKLVPTWRRAWRWFSVQTAAVVVLLGTVQTVAQEVESSSYLADITRQTWYHATMAIVAALSIALRLVHQPVDGAPEAPLEKQP